MADLPTEIARNSLTVMGIELVVSVLDDGQRIISADSMMAFLDALASGEPLDSDEAMAIAKLFREAT